MKQSFKTELEQLINRHSIENEAANTPDFLLAEYLVACLAAYTGAVKAREAWYGTHLYPGKDAGVEAPQS